MKLFKKIVLTAGLVGLTAQNAMAERIVGADFNILNADATADIGAVSGAVMALLAVIFVAKSIIGFVRGR